MFKKYEGLRKKLTHICLEDLILYEPVFSINYSCFFCKCHISILISIG